MFRTLTVSSKYLDGLRKYVLLNRKVKPERLIPRINLTRDGFLILTDSLILD